jgi:hypothetical protein
MRAGGDKSFDEAIRRDDASCASGVGEEDNLKEGYMIVSSRDLCEGF